MRGPSEFLERFRQQQDRLKESGVLERFRQQQDRLKESGVLERFRQQQNRLKESGVLERFRQQQDRLKTQLEESAISKSIQQVMDEIQQMQNRHEVDFEQEYEESHAIEAVEIFTSEELANASSATDWMSDLLEVAEKRKQQGKLSDKAFNCFLSFLMSILASFFYDACKNYLQPDSRSNVEIVREINNHFALELKIDLASHSIDSTREIRIVKRWTSISESPSGRSKTLFILGPGDVVEILKRRKKWRLILLTDSEDNKFKGWIRAKYLRATKPLSRHFQRTINRSHNLTKQKLHPAAD